MFRAVPSGINKNVLCFSGGRSTMPGHRNILVIARRTKSVGGVWDCCGLSCEGCFPRDLHGSIAWRPDEAVCFVIHKNRR